MPGPFVIVQDARGSLVHVRRRDHGECVGCIEVGLYEIVRAIVLAEEGASRPATEVGDGGEDSGHPVSAAASIATADRSKRDALRDVAGT